MRRIGWAWLVLAGCDNPALDGVEKPGPILVAEDVDLLALPQCKDPGLADTDSTSCGMLPPVDDVDALPQTPDGAVWWFDGTSLVREHASGPPEVVAVLPEPPVEVVVHEDHGLLVVMDEGPWWMVQVD